ncbi:hypothetical protein [Nitrospirillum amazonense]|uniref:hypothetical protein n=1 Tax=Nitrospirillum amazonense TaxID=28077 RepID=UPI00241243F0|nr:hypothetical protein [Nitrospirillum amazonense]MDG3439298.1 hypothetical protein [Nitrospirillum amazonense]
MTFIAEIDDKIEPIIRMIAEDRCKGIEELTELAESGDRSAIVFLGLYLSEEKETTDMAMKWLLLADGFGNPDAAWNIAMIARENSNFEEMKRWIDRASDLGEEDAKIVKENGYEMESLLSLRPQL